MTGAPAQDTALAEQAPALEQTESALAVTSCEYHISGDSLGGYTHLAVSAGEESAVLTFSYTASAGGKETAAELPVDSELLERLTREIERSGMAEWGELPPAELFADDGSVTSSAVTLSDGTVLNYSSADELPDGGEAAINAMAELMYTAVTPDGVKVFGDASSPIDLTALAEPEPELTAGDEELDIHTDMYVAEQLDIIRRMAGDSGALYSIALLGYPDVFGGNMTADRGYLTLLLEAEGYSKLSFLSRLPESCFVETETGTQLYLLLTADENSLVRVSQWVSDESGEHPGDILFDGDGGMPLLLRCNDSDGSPELQVTVTDSQGNSVSFLPRAAGENGESVAWESGVDFSNYTLAVG